MLTVGCCGKGHGQNKGQTGWTNGQTSRSALRTTWRRTATETIIPADAQTRLSNRPCGTDTYFILVQACRCLVEPQCFRHCWDEDSNANAGKRNSGARTVMPLVVRPIGILFVLVGLPPKIPQDQPQPVRLYRCGAIQWGRNMSAPAGSHQAPEETYFAQRVLPYVADGFAICRCLYTNTKQ